MKHVWVFVTPNAAVVLVYQAIQMKMGLVAKDDFVGKVAIHLLLFSDPIDELSALFMVSWFELLSHRLNGGLSTIELS